MVVLFGELDVGLHCVCLRHALACHPGIVLDLALLVFRALDVAVAGCGLFVEGVELHVEFNSGDVLEIADPVCCFLEFLLHYILIQMEEIKETIRITLQEKVKEKDTAEPTVINDDLIRDYMVKYKEEAKIYDKRETPFEDFTHLSLPFLSKPHSLTLFCSDGVITSVF